MAHRVDTAGNVAGMFADKVPGVSAGTVVDDEWLNAVQEEYIEPIDLAGDTLDKTKRDQLASAVAVRIDTIARLRAIPIPSGGKGARLVLGYAAAGDGGGGVFIWDAASAAADDGGMVILPTGHTGAGRWVRVTSLRGAVVEWFGARGDWDGAAGTDDTTAIRAAATYVQNAGGGTLRFGKGKKYRIFSDGSTTDIGAFSGINGITLDWNGAEIVVDRTFTLSEAVRVFSFTNCHNIDMGSAIMSCTQSQPANERTARGPEFADYYQGCIGVRAGVTKATDFRQVWHLERAPAEPLSYASRNFDLGVTHATRCGYPLSSTLSGYNLKAVLHTDTCGRSYFPTGGFNHQVDVYSKNHEASVDCLIATDNGQGMRGLRLNYTNTESTTADNSINCVRIEFQDSELYDGTHADIHVHLNIETIATTWLGYGLEIGKVLSTDVADTVDRGHELNNISVSGSIVGKSANQRTLGICNVGTWGIGEFVHNFCIKDLRLSPSIAPALINLASVWGPATFENFTSSAVPTITKPTKGNIFWLGANAIGVNYNGDLTGVSAATTVGINYFVNGNMVTLEIENAQGTSNTTACSVTGMPAAIRPAFAAIVVGRYQDNGVTYLGLVRINTNGDIELLNAAGASAFFTASGTKGIPGQTISYRLS